MRRSEGEVDAPEGSGGAERRVRALLCALAGCLSLVGCQEDLNIESERFVCTSSEDCLGGYGCVSTEPEVSVCLDCQEAPWGGSCRGCMEAACCAESRACADEVSCQEERRCRVACGDTVACRATCGAQTVVGVHDSLVSYQLCRSARCQEACGDRCGGLSLPLGDAEVVEACVACTNAHCCELLEACGQDPACVDLLACLRSSPAYDHTQACLQLRPAEDQAAFRAVMACVVPSCTDDCGGGQRWECLDTYSSARAGADAVTWTFRLFNGGTRNDVEGLTLKVCNPGDVECGGMGQVAVSDDEGEAALEMPTFQQGFMGFIEVADVEQDRFMPLRHVFTHPVTVDGLTRAVFLVSRAQIEAFKVLNEAVGGPPIDEVGRGAILIETHDCLGQVAEGVRFELDVMDEDTTVFYDRNGFLDFNAEATTASGVALIINVPPGDVTLTARRVDTGEIINQTRMVMLKGMVNQLRVVPTAQP